MDNKNKKRNLLILSIGLLISGLTACSYIEDLWRTLDRKGTTRASEMNISTVQRGVWAMEKQKSLEYLDIKDDGCIRLSKDEFLHDFMAEKFANQLTGEPTKKVLRITVTGEIIHTDYDLNCGGTVKWDDSTKDEIQFYRYIDDDGDEFWGWRNYE